MGLMKLKDAPIVVFSFLKEVIKEEDHFLIRIRLPCCAVVELYSHYGEDPPRPPEKDVLLLPLLLQVYDQAFDEEMKTPATIFIQRILSKYHEGGSKALWIITSNEKKDSVCRFLLQNGVIAYPHTEREDDILCHLDFAIP